MADDASKDFVCPTGKIWMPLFIEASIKATATVGNRSLGMRMFNVVNALIMTIRSGGNVAATQYGTVLYVFGGSPSADATAVVDLTGAAIATSSLMMGAPSVYMTEGQYIRVFDQNSVDVAADDMVVSFHYIEYDA